MPFTETLSLLALSFAITGYLYYGIVHVPEDMDGRDDVMWMYGKRKLTQTLSTAGEYLGLGNRVVLSRSIAPLLTFPSPVDTSQVQISFEQFGDVRVRVYRPDSMVRNGPAMLWIHGGGWVTRTVESDDPLACELARRLGILIVSVDYRLAPEHPFPAAFDDCVAATRHLMEHASEYNVNPNRVVIAGASAGGNLAAAVALKLRDDKFRYQPQQQVLVVPCLQAIDFHTPSYHLHGNNAFLSKDWMLHYWFLYGFGYHGNRTLVGYAYSNDHTSPAAKMSRHAKYASHNALQQKHIPASYMPDNVEHGDAQVWAQIRDVIVNPYFAPLMADDVSGLPPAYVLTADYDVLRDDGLMYARRIADAGGKVVTHNYERAYHAVINNFKTIDVSKQAIDDLVKYLVREL